MAEQFEEVYVYVSTHGDGPKIDDSLAKALNAVQEDEFEILESRVAALEENPGGPGTPGVPNLDFTQQNAMRFGGPSGAAQELVSTPDGRAILTSTLTEQQSILGITSGRGNLIMGNLLSEGDDIIFGAVNA